MIRNTAVLFVLALSACSSNKSGPTDASLDQATPVDASVPEDLAASPDLAEAPDLAVSCVPASASVDHYVDPVNGTDDTNHGGAPGTCAYKTITYALLQATGTLILASGTYSVASNAETFPLTLAGEQKITCNAGASIVGNGEISGAPGYQATVMFGGTKNVIGGCTVDGQGGANALGIVVGSVGGTIPDGHRVINCDLTAGLGKAIVVAGSNVQILHNHIHDSDTGIGWGGVTGGDRVGEMSYNTFKNITNADIICYAAYVDVIPSPGGSGTDIDLDADGGHTFFCVNCAHCANF